MTKHTEMDAIIMEGETLKIGKFHGFHWFRQQWIHDAMVCGYSGCICIYRKRRWE